MTNILNTARIYDEWHKRNDRNIMIRFKPGIFAPTIEILNSDSERACSPRSGLSASGKRLERA